MKAQVSLALLMTVTLLAGCARTPLTVPNAASGGTVAGDSAELLPELPGAGDVLGAGHVTYQLRLGAPALPQPTELQRLPDYRGPDIQPRLSPLAVATNPNLLNLRMLVLTAGPNDYSLPTARAMLNQAGIPYDVVDTTVTPLTETVLIDPANGAGRYQGVILTSNTMVYEASPGAWQSALDPDEWNVLWGYERTYKVRQLSLYTYPSNWPEEYGLRENGAPSDTANVVPSSGQSVTVGLKGGVAIPVRNAYNYPASVLPSAEWTAQGLTSVQPVLQDASNPSVVFGALATTSDGREKLALTMSHNEYFLHSQLLQDPLVQWVTRGLYLGNYQRSLQVDIDDWFLPNDQYDPATGQVRPDAYRLTPTDALSVRDQQAALRASTPVAQAFRYAMAFNGGGANVNAPASCSPSVGGPDPLTSVSRCLASSFDWVNHTRDHLYMDFLNYSQSYTQVATNRNIATRLGLALSQRGLVTGDMSGLGYYNPAGDGDKTNFGLQASNPAFLRAAVDSKVVYVASNRSVDGQWDPGCVGCGVRHPLNTRLLLVPRWPTNIFYYATTPQEITASYNAVYGPGGTRPYWDHPLTYDEILDKESDLGVSHLLSGAAFPHYMHVANLREYAPGRSVASDWVGAVLNKYSLYTTLPLNTQTWDNLGQTVDRRTTFAKNQLTALWNRSARTLTLKSATGGALYVTGLTGGTNYAGRSIRYWDMSRNQTLTVTTP